MAQKLTAEEIEAIRSFLRRSDKLDEMIAWYEQQQRIGASSIKRPSFRRDITNTGIAINKAILERAKEKMQAERSEVGKSLSQLIEFLLWQYIGSPEDVLE